ncbi:hypothetical protein [Chamaesiphon minutus]|uniref:Uncharacterized protein n=1 Tax=Chamaesiphon minutus (strain ATCC 27169 / PCC 6605) TaxID=1173020 RepID=K9URG7_CHAP6|nr:hypothetical protein [Chamaesiphon minutus]AFY96839.1 hypothetical protein Cha6605_5994 [Chamaesiphon minutus PCC 6605]
MNYLIEYNVFWLEASSSYNAQSSERSIGGAERVWSDSASLDAHSTHFGRDDRQPSVLIDSAAAKPNLDER